jgi:hypothetical protein
MKPHTSHLQGFLTSMTAKDTWNAFKTCWSDTYLGPPDFLRIDQGTNFVAHAFQQQAFDDGISVIEAPVESANTMSHVERYHAPLRAAYLKIRSTCGRDTSNSDVLQLAVKAVNDTVGPEGLFSTLLVFGSIPRPARTTRACTQLSRASALEKGMREVERIHAENKVAFGLRYRGPYGREREDLTRLNMGDEALVYRDASGQCEGLFRFIAIDGDTVTVQLPHGRRIFRSTVVKPVTENRCAPARLDIGPQIAMMAAEAVHAYDFGASRKLEIHGLKHRETFDVINRSTVPPDLRMFKTKWVDTIKTRDDGSVFPKSRLVAQNFRDDGAADIDIRVPTFTRMSQRLAVASAAMTPQHTAYIRDISQAYIQSTSNLTRPVYLEAPAEMGLSGDELLLARKPLYGVPESSLHWFLTHHGHHTEKLGMSASKADNCLLYHRVTDETGKEKTDGITILQVDDSFGHGTESFLDIEEEGSSQFDCKPRLLFNINTSARFNGTNVQRTKSFFAIEEEGSSQFDCKPRLLFNINTSARFNGTNVQRTKHGFIVHQQDKLDKIRSSFRRSASRRGSICDVHSPRRIY